MSRSTTNTTRPGSQKESLVAEGSPKDLPDHLLLHGWIKVDGYDHPGQIAHLGDGQEDLPPSTSFN